MSINRINVLNKALWLLVILMHIPQWGFAQLEEVNDTLDWRGYYPLEIGNIWEWRTQNPGVWFGGDVNSLNHREIVSDTTINDRKYLVQVAYSANEFVATDERKVVVWRDYLRYDTLKTRVVKFDLNLEGEHGYTCDLSADFNSVGACYDWLDMGVGGDYASEDNFQVSVGSDYVSYNAVKSFDGLTGGSKYYHGIGSLPIFGDGSEDGTIEFTYVKVGDNEYGTRSVRVGIEKTTEIEESPIELYPNPVKSQLNIATSSELRGIKVRIVDVLGRSTPWTTMCEEKRCQLDVSSLNPGLYVLEYSGPHQVYGSQSFTVAR